MLKNIDKEVLAYLGGGAVDNAASARDEIHKTFDGLMELLRQRGDGMEHFYGVLRQAIIIPDSFHIDSIATSAASIRFSGDTDRGNHRYFHEWFAVPCIQLVQNYLRRSLTSLSRQPPTHSSSIF